MAVPAGFNTLSAYLVVADAEEAMAFYEKAFGAERGMVMRSPAGGIMHAEVKIGNSHLMLSNENPQWQTKSALTLGGSPISLHMYVDDADAAFNKAVAAGCTVGYPLNDAFWGDRYGKVTDPFGISWGIATQNEVLTEEQIAQRAKEFFASMQQEG